MNDELESLNKKLKKTSNSIDAQEISNTIKWKTKQLNALLNNSKNNLVDVIKENINENTKNNVDNNDNLSYNNTERDGGVDGYNRNEQRGIENIYKQKNEGEQGKTGNTIDSSTRESFMGSKNQNDAEKFYEEFEQQARKYQLTKLSNEQQQVKDVAKKIYNKDAIYYNDTNTKFRGGISKLDKTSVFLGQNAIAEYGETFLLGHEIGEDMLKNHNEIVGKQYEEMKEKIQNDVNFPNVFLDYIYSMDEELRNIYIEHPEAIAKELICDTLGFMQNDNELGNNLPHKNITDIWINKLDKSLLHEIKNSLKKYHNEIYLNNKINQSGERSNLRDVLLPTKKYVENSTISNLNEINLPTKDYFENKNRLIASSYTAQNNTKNQIKYSIDNFNDTNNNLPQNGFSEQLNNRDLPMQSYQYERSNNLKIDNLRKDASKFFNNTDKAHNFINMLEKIISDKDIEIRLDTNLKTEDGKIANGSYSNGIITINPNSNRAGEFISIHELTHAIGTKQMLDMVDNYRSINSEFNSAVETLLKNYNSTEITEEALADVSAQLFGNQEFINNLSLKNPNLFKKVYNEIKYLWHQFRGYKNQNQFINDLHYKWEQAYRKNNKLNDTTNYSIQTDNNGNQYVKVDTDQNIFEGKSLKEQKQIARDYILDNFRENGIIKGNENINISRRTANEYTNPKNIDNKKQLSDKLKASTELDNLLTISKYKYSSKDDGRHIFANKGWDYYETTFQIGNKVYTGLLNIANGDKGKLLYDITQIKETTIPYSVKTVSMNSSSSNNSILPTKEDVNRNTTKYSMQESENNSDSFNLSTKNWSQYLEDNFKTNGTRTNLNAVKLPTKEYFENRIIDSNTLKSNENINTNANFTSNLINMYNQMEALKNTYEKVSSKESLGDMDRLQVERLLNKEITIDELPKDINKRF